MLNFVLHILLLLLLAQFKTKNSPHYEALPDLRSFIPCC